MGLAGLTRHLGGAPGLEVPVQSLAGVGGKAAADSPDGRMPRPWPGLHIPATSGSPCLPLSHPSRESCFQHGEWSPHAGLANHLEFSRNRHKAKGRRTVCVSLPSAGSPGLASSLSPTDHRGSGSGIEAGLGVGEWGEAATG